MKLLLVDELRAFWPRYVAHHAHPANRALHYAADWAAVLGVLASLVLRRPLPAAAGALAALALVVIGHVTIERNAPLVFRRPLLATLCNLRMACRARKGVRRRKRLGPSQFPDRGLCGFCARPLMLERGTQTGVMVSRLHLHPYRSAIVGVAASHPRAAYACRHAGR
jgi:hypothetical protein